ncbi:hypothetical protein glysoja_042730 [Glycine soja]|uniref:Uncharacterized protein n=1 Tax=Glycine soja TaxID=3848 RepID=A0A0B2PR82_GLYSO|nr:hypothetical protein glysoja_042730 [Glycine soja]
MELRCCGHLHFIQAIKGDLVTKAPNVVRGQPKLKFKKLTDIYDGLLSHNDDGMVERSCLGEIEESPVKTKPDASICNVNDDDDQRIINLDDDNFDNFTLSQIKASCKTRKRKHSQGLDSSKINMKVEDSSFLEDYREEQRAADDSDFLQTLSSLKSKLSKNMKTKKKKCFEEPSPTDTQEIMLVIKSEPEEILNNQEFPPSSEEILDYHEFSPSSQEIQDCQEFSPSCEEIQDGQEFPPTSEEIKIDQEIPFFSGDSVALVEVKSEVPEADCYGEPDDYCIIESQEAEIIYEWNLENELDEWQERVDFIPLRMVRPSCMDIVISNYQLSNDQSPYMPAIEFESEECIINPDLHYISPQGICLVEDHNSDIHDNQPDGDTDTAVSLPNVVTHKDLDCLGVEFKDDNIILDDCSSNEFTTGAEDQVECSSTMEHDCSNDEFTAGNEDLVEPSSTIEHDCSNDEFTAGNEDQVEPSSTIDNSSNDEFSAGSEDQVEPSSTIEHDCTNDEFTAGNEDQVEASSTIEHDSSNDEFSAGSGDQVEPSSTIEHDCSIDEFTTGSEDKVELSSTIEHGPNPDECLVCHSDDPPEYEEKQSFASVNIAEKRHVNVATDELTSWDECDGSSKLHHSERLLSTRKAISPSSEERLCKAVESVNLNHKNNLKCKEKLYFSEKTDKMNSTAEGLDDITGARLTDIFNKISVIPRSKRVSQPRGISKNAHSSRQATRIGCNSVQSCSKSAIAFTQQQMHDAECLAMRLTKELKSMKDIVDDMLRSEFCLNTSLRHKVNEARMAVKNATRAEEATKRCLAFMSRDCSRFCKIMKFADDSPSPQKPPPDVVRKERKKIAFADEAGGKLFQVKFYEDDAVSLSKSN